ncbi:dehydrogenase [Dictyobacter sp. S3.2.2.5]|uniref:Dehydrogenase n=1 Tax=Dictyobacter halimunensis TaxID=3026934 RepID=A0ABQ6FMI4_9CHLR|nr:dehydrogenase [Dictyobacter sp. S3.2.2.5]
MKLGVIGYGARISWIVELIRKQAPECSVAAVVDVRKEGIKRGVRGQHVEDAVLYETPDHMFDNVHLDGVLIGTHCSLHTPMALKVLPHGIPLYLEKPVAITMEDLVRLKRASEVSTSPVVVSFPLRVTSLVKLVKEIIGSGTIGTVEHVQAFNNVPYGGVYFHSWYRDENETGGLFLQKATHDFDYLTYVLGYKPITVCAMTSKQVFKGTKPAGLKCIECDENQVCAESALRPENASSGEYCCFATDTGNEDSGSALVRYDTGMHLSYSQNFMARRKAGTRGARFIGYKGTVEFDFYSGVVKVYMHHIPQVRTYEVDSGEDHFGGDAELVRNFIDVMHGRAQSIATLEEGMQSALLCLAAKESAQTCQFQSIDYEAV